MLNVRKMTRSANLLRARKRLGQKPPLKLKDIWAIRIRLQLAGRLRDLALFNLAIDSKLRGCDLVKLRVHDRHAWRLHPGSIMSDCLPLTICSKAGSAAPLICLGGNMLDYSRPGFEISD